MEHRVHRAWRLLVVTVWFLAGPGGVTPLMAGGGSEVERVPLTWLNVADYAVVPAESCRVAAQIDDALGVELSLRGGPMGSTALSEQLYLAMLRGGELPDIFPWHHVLISSYPPIQELYAPISIDQVRRLMPNTFRAIESSVSREGAAELWADLTIDGKLYAVPKLTTEYSYLPGILWRRDILEELGMVVPETLGQWERVFEAYTRRHPGEVSWGGIEGHGFVFETVLQAAAIYPSSFYRSGEELLPGILLPQFRDTLALLRRWYERGYIRIFPQNDGAGSMVPDTDGYFASGKIIVTDNARCTRGDMICDPPYYAHSLPERTQRAIPGATFVVGPLPRLDAASPARTPSGSGLPYPSGFFGFNRKLEAEPARLERAMQLVDAILGDERLYLLTQFGTEGADWRWEIVGGARRPVRIDPADRSANIGTYWLMGYSPFEQLYGLDPRISRSIDENYKQPGAIYAASAESGLVATGSSTLIPVSFRVPYSDQSEQATADKRDYQRTFQGLHELVYRSYFVPILEGRLELGALDELRARYFAEGGRELIAIIQRWSRG